MAWPVALITGRKNAAKIESGAQKLHRTCACRRAAQQATALGVASKAQFFRSSMKDIHGYHRRSKRMRCVWDDVTCWRQVLAHVIWSRAPSRASPLPCLPDPGSEIGFAAPALSGSARLHDHAHAHRAMLLLFSGPRQLNFAHPSHASGRRYAVGVTKLANRCLHIVHPKPAIRHATRGARVQNLQSRSRTVPHRTVQAVARAWTLGILDGAVLCLVLIKMISNIPSRDPAPCAYSVSIT